ncbi:MAG: DUF58 domain-containing protein [Planctomycetes bacterium]|nr:DUF58 domain-containing protein [Planctomycetota bacterium]
MSRSPQSSPTAVELARKARTLKIQTQRSVRERLAGAYKTAFHGTGLTFEELRHYQPGDEIRHIDWRATARFGEPYVRHFEEERELRVLFAFDISDSMGNAAESFSARNTACKIAAMLSLSAVRGGDRVGALFFGGNDVLPVAPRKGDRQVLQILRHCLFEKSSAETTDPRGVLRKLQNLRSHAVVFLISDMFFNPPLTDPSVRSLTRKVGRRHEVVAISIYPHCVATSRKGIILQTRDFESGKNTNIDLYGLGKDKYLRREGQRTKNLDETLATFAEGCVWVEAGNNPEPALRDFFGLMASRRPRSVREE